MAENEFDLRYENGKALCEAAEKRFGRPLTTAEWAGVDPDGYYRNSEAAFDTRDLEDLLGGMRKLPARATPSPEQKQRKQALARSERIAAEARDLVEEQRQWVFGRHDPPFPEDARTAAAWVEEEAARGAETARVQLTLVAPATHPDALGLWRLRDWLAETLGRGMPSTVDEAWPKLLDLLGDPGSPLIHFGPERSLLRYLGIGPSGEFGVKRVPAADGSTLGDLLVASEEVAQQTGWDVLASTHHLLTGGLMSTSLGSTPRIRVRLRSSPEAKITLEIDDPAGISAGEVARAYTKAGSQMGPIPMRRQRGRTPLRHGVAVFVEVNPGTWAER